MVHEIRIALIGNPNVGKTSMFNALTGSRQHVGNWPGVTVEKKTGTRAYKGVSFQVTDLPGTYSLCTRSPDEAIARDFITAGGIDVVVQVVDATNLERNLYLTTQLMETGSKVVIALNMSDQMDSRGDRFDIARFEELWGIPVVKTAASLGEGITDLLDRIIEEHKAPVRSHPVEYGPEIDTVIDKVNDLLRKDPGLKDKQGLRWFSVSLLEGDKTVRGMVGDKAVEEDVKSVLRDIDAEQVEMSIIEKRYAAIVDVLGVVYERGVQTRSFSDAVDRVVTNKYLGIPIFLALIWGVFQITFTAAAPFSSMIDMAFSSLGEFVSSNVQPDWLASLLGDGIIGGVGFVLIFLPNILVMFVLLAFLEDSGYLSRAAFIMDRIMSKIGLHGKSFIPMLLGLGCNLPAIMATRTIEDKKSRLITILTIPFISCSARLPVFVLLAGAFFPSNAGTVVFAMYVLGIVVAIVSAKLFRSTILKGESESFIMELPPYRLPTAKGTLLHMWDRGSAYVKKAGTIIMIGSAAIWLLASLPWGVEYGGDASYAGAFGRLLEPLVAPLGFDWKIAVALLFGFIAKEVVVGALSVLYGSSEESLGDAISGSEGLSAVGALGLMVFVLIYTPCLATLGVIKGESGSWKWVAFSVVYGLTLAWLLAFAVVKIGGLLGYS
ncbi:MAG: ferrous iron transport protein B [Methanomassiliicoccales archaeon]|jgi:ferrous iron transport protein B